MGEMRVPPDRVRLTDAQRQETVNRLGGALRAGCLTVAEFDERVSAVWAASVRAEIEMLTADLPSSLPPLSTDNGRAFGDRIRPALRAAGGAWLAASVVSVVVWAMLCMAGGQLIAPFWAWVLCGGATILAPLWHLVEVRATRGSR